jgi:glycogen synthase
MRIALLPSAYSPMVGGVEELTYRLAAAHTRAGHTVEVWAPVPDAQGAWGTSIDGTVAVHRMPMPLWPATPVNVLLFPIRFLWCLRSLWRAHRALRPDVIHVQCFSAHGAYATALSVITGTPLVVTLQGETFMDANDAYGRSWQLRLALRLGLRRARVITACSRYTLDDSIRRFGADPTKSLVIFNGVDLEEPAGPAKCGSYVLGVGRVVREKGFDLLLDAFAVVAGSHPETQLVIAGDGPELASLRQRARDLDIEERVELRGHADRETVGALMAGAQVVVVPSRVEPFGIVVLEAWRAGRAVIASARGGISEFVADGKNGLVVDPLDATALAESLRRCLSDPSLRQRLGDNARRSVPQFAWDVIAARYREVMGYPTSSMPSPVDVDQPDAGEHE